jgi:ribonuclease VapC
MVIDTSALIAILLGEPETAAFVQSLADAPKRMISALNALEAAVVIEAKKGEAGGREFDLLIHRARIEIIPLNSDHMALALRAWRKFGKGNHPAGLNIGDCCAYALARYSGEPLLFKDGDFSKTDIQPVADV